MTLLGQQFRIPLDTPPEPESEWPKMFKEIQAESENSWATKKFGPGAKAYLDILSGSRDILSGLQADPGGRRRPKKGQGKKENQFKALDYLRRCSEDKFPPPKELVEALEICSENIGTRKTSVLTKEQMKALEFELAGNWKLKTGDGWYTDVSSDAVALHLGHSDEGRNVRNWRRQKAYRQAFIDELLKSNGNKK